MAARKKVVKKVVKSKVKAKAKARVVKRNKQMGRPKLAAHVKVMKKLKVGDVVAVPATGAYHQTMAHTYNLFGRPAAVLVDAGAAHVITRRESTDDLFARDV